MPNADTSTRSSLWFLGPSTAQAIGAGLGLLSNVVYARDLGTHNYGLFAISISIGMVLSTLADGGVTTFLNSQSRSNVFAYRPAGHLYKWPLGRFVVTGSLIAATLFLLSRTGLISSEPGMIACGAVAIGFSYAVFQISQTALQVAGRYTMRNLMLIWNAIATLSFAVIFALAFDSFLLQLLGSSLGYAAAATSGSKLILSTCQFDRTHGVERRILRDSRSLMIANIFNYGTLYGDVALVGAITNPQLAGTYQIAKKFAQTATMPFAALIPVLMSRIARDPHTAESGTMRWVRASSIVFIFGNVLSFFVAIPLVEAVFGRDFSPALALLLAVLLVFELQFHKDLFVALSSIRNRFTFVARASALPLVSLGIGAFVLLLSGNLVLFGLVLAFGQLAAVYLLSHANSVSLLRVTVSVSALATVFVYAVITTAA